MKDTKRTKFTIRLRLPRWLSRVVTFLRRHRQLFRSTRVRVVAVLIVIAIVGGEVFNVLQPHLQQQAYAMSSSASALLHAASGDMAKKLSLDPKDGTFNFNANFIPAQTGQVSSGGPHITATLNKDPGKGIKITDPTNQVDFSMTPTFHLRAGEQHQNRVIYPLSDNTGWLVYTMQAAQVKEDILLDHADSDNLAFSYKLAYGSSIEPRLQRDGSIGVFGTTLPLNGNVTTGSEKDAELLQKVREKAPKDSLLFTIPAPVVSEYGQTKSNVAVRYQLDGHVLSVVASGLKQAHYPLTIDPSVYVESAAKFMHGNNESNVDFDTTDDLIQKGVLTGGRYTSMAPDTEVLPSARWGAATVVTGGYIYVIGGSSGTTNFGNVYWAKLDTATYDIDSPDPVNCTNWCTGTAYNLPSSQVRRYLSATAYNGYLYAIGGKDAACAGTNNACGTVYYAKLGANGEPISWTATTTLGTARFNFGSAAYNNKLYITGGQTNTSLNGDQSVESANINPDGTLSAWSTSGMTTIPTAGRWGHTMLQYNGFLYLVGGASTTTLQNSVQYIKVNADGTLASSWVTTTAFDTARASFGGTFASIWGGYMYIDGGCATVTTTDCSSFTTYNTGTASQATTVITGSGTTWTAAMVGRVFTFANGTATVITRFTDATHLVASVSQTVGSQAYTIDLGQATAQLASINADGTVSDWTQFAVGASTFYNTGTASQSTTTVTGAGGANFVTAGVLPGMLITYANGVVATITVVNTTTLTVVASQTVTSQAYAITNPFARNMGAGFIAWRNTVYMVGGCAKTTSSGNCSTTNGPQTYSYSSQVNTDGDTSPAQTEVTLPAMGTTSTTVGRASSAVVINNGFIYSIGGCGGATFTNGGCNTMNPNTVYAQINSDGSIGTWNIDSTGTLNGASGLGAGGATVYNNTVYYVGGTNGSGTWQDAVNRATFNSDGTLTSWTNQTAILPADYGYQFVFARAANATTGNLYVMGGCESVGSAGVGCSTYYTNVLKCTITNSTGAVSGCTTTGQLQIQDLDASSAAAGLGLMGGTVYGDYIYLAGGACGSSTTAGQTAADRGCDGTSTTNVNTSETNKVIFAKINSSNNIVRADNGNATGGWQISANHLPRVRRRNVAYTVNGYLYVTAGHDGTTSSVATLSDVAYAKIDQTTGDIGAFTTLTATITPRWNLGAVAANGYIYLIGGCTTGNPPTSCTAMSGSSESIQVYNNYSGSPKLYSAATSQLATDRYGAGAAVNNGYLYIAGGCTSTTDCTTDTTNVAFAQINPDGNITSWTTNAAYALPTARAYGGLVASGGTLYYIGGQDSSCTVGNGTGVTGTCSAAYYSTPNGSGVPAAWTITTALTGERSGAAVTVFNGHIYALGGTNGAGTAQTTAYYSSDVSAGGAISGWSTGTAFTTARSGAVAIAYGSTLFLIGGFDGTNYLLDSQYTNIATNGSIGSWTSGTSLPQFARQATGFAANGYLYVFGGRSAATTCTTATYTAPIIGYPPGSSNRYGIGSWSQTNVAYTGSRYGAAGVYGSGRAYLLGGQCNSTLTGANSVVYSTLQAQPQIATYSLMIDTDTDVTPSKWLMNGIDNGVGAQWRFSYRSSTSATNSWGQVTDYGVVTLGTPAAYIPLNGAGTNTLSARYYYLYVTVDASQAFGYPEDVTRGPTISDITLQFASDPSKRLMHGRTFTGGIQQPDDTPF